MIDIANERMDDQALAEFAKTVLQPVLINLGHLTQLIESKFETPVPTNLGGHPVWRYQKPTTEHVIIQRLYRGISGLKSCYLLLQQGQIQEVGVILRTVNEFQQDITFLLENYGKGQTEHQILFVKEVLKEGYIDINVPFNGAVPHAMVSRQKILAAVARQLEAQINRNDGQKLSELDTDILSCFVHGAYPAVMDIYGHDPRNPRYHPYGVKTARILYTWVQQIIVYLERQIMDVFFVAHSFGIQDVQDAAYDVKKSFETESAKYGHSLAFENKNPMNDLKKGKPLVSKTTLADKDYPQKK